MPSSRTIFLKPIGGLCNRLRTIDSFISICEIEKIDLIVFWSLDETLNSRFHSLFETITFPSFSMSIIDCPKGFPENNLIKLGKKKEGGYKIDLNSSNSSFKNLIKYFLLVPKINATHRGYLRQLKALGAEDILLNEDLSEVYSSSTQLNKTIREMDNKFISNIENDLKTFLKKNPLCYIECCYRVAKMTSRYDYLQPTTVINTAIKKVISEFNPFTVGLHIRRTDHKAAKEVSTEEKFLKIASKELEANIETNFFVSTDDPVTKARLKKEFGEKIISHDVTSYSRNSESAIVDAVVDLFSLSKTTKIYGSHHSSFSQTAADLVGGEEIIL
jgi:hypothetical protein